MISGHTFERANLLYSRGQITYLDLVEVLKGNVRLEVLEAERLAV